MPTVSTEEKTASVHTSITTPTAGAGVDELEHTQPVDVTEEGISSTSSSSRDRRGELYCFDCVHYSYSTPTKVAWTPKVLTNSQMMKVCNVT